jgi:hypothetical protein
MEVAGIMQKDWTSIHLPRTPRDCGVALLSMTVGLLAVALIAFAGFSLRGVATYGIVLATAFVVLAAIFGALGLVLIRFSSPADEARAAVAAVQASRNIFGSSDTRSDGRPLSKEEADVFSDLRALLEKEDPREGSGKKA